MKFNTSYILAFALFLIGVIWFALNNFGKEAPQYGQTPAKAQAQARQTIPRVHVRDTVASWHNNILSLYGQTRAYREVTLKAETAGSIIFAEATEGKNVPKGATLCRQDLDARQAIVDQAKANLAAIEADLNAVQALADKGYQSETRVNAMRAQYDGARASLAQAEIEADNVNIRAPFSGIWERQIAQVGDYLAPGMPCGLLIDLSPLKINIQLTETQLSHIKPGDTAQVELATGETVRAKLAYIDTKADPTTRTFRAELQVPNPEYKLRAGVTATVHLNGERTKAQQVPAHILTLDTDGTVGLRYVDRDNIVRFAAVTTIDEDEAGLWVSGLPDPARIIIEGQDFVRTGMEVKPELSYKSGSQTVSTGHTGQKSGQK